MDWRIDYVNVSSCMLFETIGDSEAESNVNHNDDIDHGSSHGVTGLAEDDAFSCSCENENYSDFDYPSTGTGDYVDVDDDQKELVVEEEQSMDGDHEYDEDEDEDAVDQVRKEVEGVMIKEAAGQRTKKLKVCGTAEFLNEEGDKDRLFWETCLAS